MQSTGLYCTCHQDIPFTFTLLFVQAPARWIFTIEFVKRLNLKRLNENSFQADSGQKRSHNIISSYGKLVSQSILQLYIYYFNIMDIEVNDLSLLPYISVWDSCFEGKNEVAIELPLLYWGSSNKDTSQISSGVYNMQLQISNWLFGPSRMTY